ncbi:MAG: hypothetical protein KDC38_17195, partial [Planctomycetes bacterium]|nr:hypothetical protein [Planctomycetota bacterium]
MQSTASEATAPAAKIEVPYLLLTHIPYCVDERGRICLGGAWKRDLERHFEYLGRMVLVAPQHDSLPEEPDLVPLVVPDGVEFRVSPLPRQDTSGRALLALPKTFLTLWREIRRASVVHSGIVGWPYPLGWIANPLALLFKRPLVILVESAHWRLSGDGPYSWRQRLRAAVTEKLARFFVRRADLTIFTQPSYRDSMLGEGARSRGEIIPASWIDESDIRASEDAEVDWQRKRAEMESRPRLLFAGRLTREKGIPVLLEAIQILDERGVRVRVDVIGEGPLREACEEVAADLEH